MKKADKTYIVWDNDDPNNCFEITVRDGEDPVQVALSEVGYSISADPVTD